VLDAFPPAAFASTQALPFCVELIPAAHNKGSALALLLAHLNAARAGEAQIAPAHVLAFGDGGNDVPLLAAAGMPVAMANAMPGAAAVAKWRTGSNDEGGVGMFLEKVFFPEEGTQGGPV
jgi:hydroxymethylpyrimidine pyrophosphatase-like HAD family hydrolase